MRKGLRAEKRSADAIAILKDVWVCRLLEMFLDQSPLIKFSRHLAPDFASAATFEVVGGKLRQTSDGTTLCWDYSRHLICFLHHRAAKNAPM